MLHLDTPLSFAILTEVCRIWEQSTVSHPKTFVDFHFAATQIFNECFDLVQISQHNWHYRMIPFYWYVLYIGTLLCWHANDVRFMGCDSHFGTQKNYATTTLAEKPSYMCEASSTSSLPRQKETDLTQSYMYDKSPYTYRKIQKATWQHKNATKNFDYTTIADRLRTVSWGNDSHPTGGVKPVYGIPTFPLIAKAV